MVSEINPAPHGLMFHETFLSCTAPMKPQPELNLYVCISGHIEAIKHDMGAETQLDHEDMNSSNVVSMVNGTL